MKTNATRHARLGLRLRRHALVAVALVSQALALSLTPSALAQTPPPDYGLDFVTVGAAGNRASLVSEMPDYQITAGAVGHDFRITRTEVLVQDWLPFVRAYAPYWEGTPWDSRLTSVFISPDGQGGFITDPFFERAPVSVPWHMAARYVNWLHNDRAPHRAAFESGVYDTSTFSQNPDGTWNDQVAHTPGSRYWIPTFDETFKAFYYDPHRYGDGLDGYWMYPNRSNTPPVAGPPGIGETNVGNGTFGAYMQSGLYPHVTTPWGLLDASGGAIEWTESLYSEHYRTRYYIGTAAATSPEWIPLLDRADRFHFGTAPVSLYGFRVASLIPSPASSLLLCLVACFMQKRNRQ